MARDRRSFFERLTGSVQVDDEFYDTDLEPERPSSGRRSSLQAALRGNEKTPERELTLQQSGKGKDISPRAEGWDAPTDPEEPMDAQLTVDVYQTPEEVMIKTIVAGVKPEDIDIAISRDSVTIKGRREESRIINEDDYVHRELYWGSFSRTVILPVEIDVDLAEAIEKHGLLILKLPKVNRERQAKVKVKSI